MPRDFGRKGTSQTGLVASHCKWRRPCNRTAGTPRPREHRSYLSCHLDKHRVRQDGKGLGRTRRRIGPKTCKDEKVEEMLNLRGACEALGIVIIASATTAICN